MTKQNKKRFTNVAVYEETHEKLLKIADKEQRKITQIIAEFVDKKFEELELNK